MALWFWTVSPPWGELFTILGYLLILGMAYLYLHWGITSLWRWFAR